MSNIRACDWSDKERAIIIKLSTKGYSAPEIATQLGGGITKNSIVGILYRAKCKLPPPLWNQDRQKLLRKLHARNLTSRQIGQRLGCSHVEVTRECHRLGLTLREPTGGYRPNHRKHVGPSRSHGSAGTASALTYKLKAGTFGKPKLAPKPRPEPPAAPDCQPVSMLDLTDRHCKFPIGDPCGPQTMFCGAAPSSALIDRPYCGWHARLAYQPPERRSHRRAA